MANLTENITIKRLRNKYRLVVTNDDTFEEVATFRLSRVSVYVALSSAFILLVGLTICLLVFTPLKYYIPGYGNKKSLTQLQLLKYKTDSLEQAIKYNEQYYEGLQKAIAGTATLVLDSTRIKVDTEQPEDNYSVTDNDKEKKKKKRKNDDEEEDKPRKKRRKH